VIGTVGLLLLLEKRKLLSAEQILQKMQQVTEQHGMYLAPQLLQQIKSGYWVLIKSRFP
jgi:predicted nucleic acid-binding protein